MKCKNCGCDLQFLGAFIVGCPNCTAKTMRKGGDAARRVLATKNDAVDHPAHYTGHPSGVECIQITEHMNFCRGNAVKYIWRAGEKGNEVEDLRKARWYIDREIARLEKIPVDPAPGLSDKS